MSFSPGQDRNRSCTSTLMSVLRYSGNSPVIRQVLGSHSDHGYNHGSRVLCPTVQWKVMLELSSDHSPINTDMALSFPILRKLTRIFLNFGKPNQNGFSTKKKEVLFFFFLASHRLLDVEIEKFNEIILAAGKRHILAEIVQKQGKVGQRGHAGQSGFLSLSQN